MKLVRYGQPGKEKPGLIDAHGKLRDLSKVIDDVTPDQLSDKALAKLAKLNTDKLPLVKGKPRMGCPISHISKFVAIGLNYADHAAESRYVSQKNALDYVAGYCVVNDVSEREYQLERGGSWDKGKGCDTFGPIGPWMVTKDEVPNPQKLHMWLELNGKRMQDGSTKTMIFGVTKLVSYVSQFMTLNPGDVITTGTPPGVGAGIKVNGKSAPVFLRRGDVVALGIEGLGEQTQKIVAFKA